MTKYVVLLGNFGSGKSELALNFALNAKVLGNTVLVDLDIINPYFRSSDQKELLQKQGIRLVSPLFAGANIEIMTLPPDVFAAFNGVYEQVIFDAGGDAGGAVALGQYHSYFAKIPREDLAVYLVVNPRRPLSDTVSQIVSLLHRIEDSCRLQVTGLINNGNLSVETTAEDLLFSYALVSEVSRQTGIPVAWCSGAPGVLAEFLRQAELQGLDKQYLGQPFPIKVKMHRDWQSVIETQLTKAPTRNRP